MSTRYLKYLLLFSLVSFGVFGDDLRSCSNNFNGGVIPVTGIVSKDLCYTSFAIAYDSRKRVPLYVAEHLTGIGVKKARMMVRQDRFHVEYRLDGIDRVLLSDYVRGGYDRGHMVPFRDMVDIKSGYESFTLANIVPQNSNKNRYIWKQIEVKARRLALNHGSIYVITGPIFSVEYALLNGRVGIPSGFFKAVYVPSLNSGIVFTSLNIDDGIYSTTSILLLEKQLNINLFPSLSQLDKAKMVDLE